MILPVATFPLWPRARLLLWRAIRRKVRRNIPLLIHHSSGLGTKDELFWYVMTKQLPPILSLIFQNRIVIPFSVSKRR